MAGALAGGGSRDPDVFRGLIDIALVLALPEEVLGRPGLLEKVTEYGTGWRDEPASGPDRAEFVRLANRQSPIAND